MRSIHWIRLIGLPSRARPAITPAQPASRWALSTGSRSTNERARAWMTAEKVWLGRSASTPSSTPRNGKVSSSTLPIDWGRLTDSSPPANLVPASGARERKRLRPVALRAMNTPITGTHSLRGRPYRGTNVSSAPVLSRSTPPNSPRPFLNAWTSRMVKNTAVVRMTSWPGRSAPIQPRRSSGPKR